MSANFDSLLDNPIPLPQKHHKALNQIVASLIPRLMVGFDCSNDFDPNRGYWNRLWFVAWRHAPIYGKRRATLGTPLVILIYLIA